MPSPWARVPAPRWPLPREVGPAALGATARERRWRRSPHRSIPSRSGDWARARGPSPGPRGNRDEPEWGQTRDKGLRKPRDPEGPKRRFRLPAGSAASRKSIAAAAGYAGHLERHSLDGPAPAWLSINLTELTPLARLWLEQLHPNLLGQGAGVSPPSCTRRRWAYATPDRLNWRTLALESEFRSRALLGRGLLRAVGRLCTDAIDGPISRAGGSRA